MAWSGVTETTGIAEDGSSPWVTLLPKERAYVQYEREAATGTTDSMVLSVYTSPDNGTNIDNQPAMEFEVAPNATQPIGAFIVEGPPYFRITMSSIGSTDTITVTIRTMVDGGLG